MNGSETRFHFVPNWRQTYFTYSDLYREVEVIDIKETAEDDEDEEEHADNIIEVMFDDKTKARKSKEFWNSINRVLQNATTLNADKIQIIKKQ